MQLKFYNILVVLIAACTFISCSTAMKFPTRYYNEHKGILDSIRYNYESAYDKKPFHIQFKDKRFRYISFEMLSDTFRYIYNFDLEAHDFADTLYKYNYNTPQIISLIADMSSIRCIWISHLDYYENRQKKNLVFISMRHNQLESFFKGEKYYALAFFNERQFFDKQGRLTDKSERKRMREINGQVFHKITDRICYAITGNFR
ncbi:MAG TPA: hypothetical protein VF487_02515 [Chitinophagaceae bacterium]